VCWLAEPSVNESDFRCPPVVLPPRFQSFQVHCFSEPSINESDFRCPPGGATSQVPEFSGALFVVCGHFQVRSRGLLLPRLGLFRCPSPFGTYNIYIDDPMTGWPLTAQHCTGCPCPKRGAGGRQAGGRVGGRRAGGRVGGRAADGRAGERRAGGRPGRRAGGRAGRAGGCCCSVLAKRLRK
jgi:hypothetical protein